MSFVWHDLMCVDPAAAGRFYATLLGWELRGATLVSGRPFAAIQAVEPESGWPAHWLPTVTHPDIGAAVARAAVEGGHVLALEPAFAVVADLEGGALTLVAEGEPSSVVLWNELLVEDDAVRHLWAKVLGCTMAAVDMGPLGAGWVLSRGATPLASVLRSPLAPPGRWVPYFQFNVDDVAERIADAGGRVLIAPVTLPDAGRIALFADPEGAVFGGMG